MTAQLGVAVVGCGLIGTRRARAVAEHPHTALRVVVDSDRARAETLAREYGAACATGWSDVFAHTDVGAVVVSTPNALLEPIGRDALERGKHVLIEKPMGRNVAEAERLAAAAFASRRVLKIGFNHRYHPALARANELYRLGAIGRLVQMRARYGHGSRPGCEHEWRADPQLAGGGELLDQGSHIIDLFHWFAGPPLRIHAELQSAVWRRGPLEDNAFGVLRFAHDVVGQFHASMTQWRNLFSLELHGDLGALVVEGLGGSYGVETLSHIRRNMAGGPPDTELQRFAGADTSWQAEWQDFVAATEGAPLQHGAPEDGVAVMRTVAGLYAAARDGGLSMDTRETRTLPIP